MNILYVCVLFVSSVYAMDQERKTKKETNEVIFASLVADYKPKQPWFGEIPDFINDSEVLQYFPKSKCATTVNGDDWYYNSATKEWENIGNSYDVSPEVKVSETSSRKKLFFERYCLMSYVYYHEPSRIKVKIGTPDSQYTTPFNLYNINFPQDNSSWKNKTGFCSDGECIIKDVVINNSGVYCAFSMIREYMDLTGCYVKVLKCDPGTVQYNRVSKDRESKEAFLLDDPLQMGDLRRYGDDDIIIKLSENESEIKAVYFECDSRHGLPITSFLLTKHKAKMDHLRFNDDNSVEIVVQEKKTGNALLWYISPKGLKTQKEFIVCNKDGKLNLFNALRKQQPNLSIGDFEYRNNRFELKNA